MARKQRIITGNTANNIDSEKTMSKLRIAQAVRNEM